MESDNRGDERLKQDIEIMDGGVEMAVGMRSYCRLLRQLWAWSLPRGNKTVLMFTLIGIIQWLSPEHYGEVMNSIIKAVAKSNNQTGNGQMECERLIRTLARLTDGILVEEKSRAGVRCAEIGD